MTKPPQQDCEEELAALQAEIAELQAANATCEDEVERLTQVLVSLSQRPRPPQFMAPSSFQTEDTDTGVVATVRFGGGVPDGPYTNPQSSDPDYSIAMVDDATAEITRAAPAVPGATTFEITVDNEQGISVPFEITDTIVDSAIGLPAQDMSPSSVQINTSQSGVIARVTFSGGISNVYDSPAIAGADAADYSIAMVNDTQADLTQIATEAAGVKNITIAVDNDAGTSEAFAFAATVVADAPTARSTLAELQALFPIPSLPAWPVVEIERNAGSWRVATSAVGGIAVNATFTTISAAFAACQAITPTIVSVVTPGAYTEVMNFSAPHGALLGPVDGNGKPTVTIMPDEGGTPIRCWNPNIGADCWFKNFQVGPADSEIATTPNIQRGDAGIQFGDVGRLRCINIKVRHMKGNGIESSVANEWRSRRHGALDIWGCEVWNNANINTEHQLYCHAVPLLIAWSYFHDSSSGGHLVKTDNERLVLIGNTLVQNTGLRFGSLSDASAAINCTSRCDIYADYNVAFNNIDDGGSVIQLIARTNHQGGASLKTPNIGEGMRDDTTDNRDLPWLAGGKGGKNRNSRVLSYTGGTVSLDRIHPEGENGIDITLSLASSYTLRLWTRDSSGAATTYTEDFTATPATVSSSKATFTGITPARPYVVGHASLKLAADPWDTPLLNSEYYNAADPNFWWARICETGSKTTLDLSKQDLFNRTYIDTNMLIIDSNMTMNGIDLEEKHQHLSFAHNDNGFEIIRAPANKPQGATGAWPNGAGYAEWLSPQSNYPLFRGKDATGFVDQTNSGSIAYSVWPWPTFVADTHIFYADGDNGSKYVGMTRSTTFKWRPDVRELVDGSLSAVASNTPTIDRAQTTLSGAHSASAMDITVASASGAAIGKLCMLALPYATWAATGIAGVHVATVTGVAGSVVSLDTALPRDAADQAAVIFADPAGDRPSTWQRVETLAPWGTP